MRSIEVLQGVQKISVVLLTVVSVGLISCLPETLQSVPRYLEILQLAPRYLDIFVVLLTVVSVGLIWCLWFEEHLWRYLLIAGLF